MSGAGNESEINSEVQGEGLKLILHFFFSLDVEKKHHAADVFQAKG